jgi:hypothetical protein
MTQVIVGDTICEGWRMGEVLAKWGGDHCPDQGWIRHNSHGGRGN